MKPILSPAEASALDGAAQERGIAAETLMENAGREVAGAAVRLAGGTYGRRAVVVAGKGNNGGDGLVAARYLDAWGMRVTVVLFDDRSREPAAMNLSRLRRTAVRVRPWSAELVQREIARADVAVDAIFGTGFRGAPDGALHRRDRIPERRRRSGGRRGHPVRRERRDGCGRVGRGPSGHHGDVRGGQARGGLPPGSTHAGIVEVADIGFPPDLVRSDLALLETEDVAGWLPRRDEDTHKRASGFVVVIGGSRSMTGAVSLMARAAYRSGAGLVAAGVPSSILPVVQGAVREAVFAPLPETEEGTASGGTERLSELIGQAGALAIGPGMTTDERTSAWVRELVRGSEIPVVLDADGLNAFAGRAPELADRKAELVLTPHAGEFSRLTGVSAKDLAADRVGHARKLAAETQAVVLLKGTRTLVAAPDGSVRVNPTGGPFLATGGTGDVLTGMIAGLLARRLAPADAASAAAFVHGVAGSAAAEVSGEGTTASDVLERVAEAFVEVAGA